MFVAMETVEVHAFFDRAQSLHRQSEASLGPSLSSLLSSSLSLSLALLSWLAVPASVLCDLLLAHSQPFFLPSRQKISIP